MKQYKEKFFTNYVSTHISPRKGDATLSDYKWRANIYQKQFGKFLSNDKSSTIIDVGCGNGSVIWWFQQNGYINAEGIDISSEQIEVAKKIGVKNVNQADLRLFLRDKTCFYDVIIIRDVIEHFKKEEIIEILEICRDSLKKEGTIIIQVPNAESPFFGRIRYGDLTHEIAFCMSSLSQLFNMIGFDKIRFSSTEPVVCGPKSLIQLLLWKAVETFYRLLLFAELGPGYRIVTQDIIAVAQKNNRK